MALFKQRREREEHTGAVCERICLKGHWGSLYVRPLLMRSNCFNVNRVKCTVSIDLSILLAYCDLKV